LHRLPRGRLNRQVNMIGRIAKPKPDAERKQDLPSGPSLFPTLRSHFLFGRLVPVIIAFFLLTAATLKAYQLVKEPTRETSFLMSRWSLMLTANLEVLLALWLASSKRPRLARAAAISTFFLFGCLAFSKALGSAASCGCFGNVSVNPWLTLLIDLTLIAALFIWNPARIPTRSPAGRTHQTPPQLLRGP